MRFKLDQFVTEKNVLSVPKQSSLPKKNTFTQKIRWAPRTFLRPLQKSTYLTPMQENNCFKLPQMSN